MTGDYPNDSLLIEAPALAELLNGGSSDSVRVLDCAVFLEPAQTGYRAVSGRDRYRQGHVPGAAFMDLISDFSDTGSGLGFTRPAAPALQRKLGELGVSETHRVVVYSSAHMMWATRGFWLLRYAGHRNVQVLNGGYRA